MNMKALEHGRLPMPPGSFPHITYISFSRYYTIIFLYNNVGKKKIEFLCRINVPNAIFSRIDISLCPL